MKKSTNNSGICTWMLLAVFLVLSVATKGQPHGSVLELDGSKINQLKAELLPNGAWQLETSGKDPWICTQPLKQEINGESKILSFEYFSPKGLDHLQIYFGPMINQENSKLVRRIGLAEGWVGYTIDLSKEIKSWGKTGDWLRLDFGSRPNVNIQIRNIQLRPMTVREKELLAGREEKVKREAAMEARLKAYLTTDYASEITRVEVEDSKISVGGKINSTTQVYLCEVAPYQDVTEQTNFETAILITS